MRRLEKSAIEYGLNYDDLIEKAGLAVAKETVKILRTAVGKRILVLVGPGNNGTDGLVAARHLARWGSTVVVYLVTGKQNDQQKIRLAREQDVLITSHSNDKDFRKLESEIRSSDAIMDAVLGTGRSRPLDGTTKTIMLRLNEYHGILISLDIPTGIDADTGHMDPATPKATFTLALGHPKVGHFQIPAAEKVGQLEILDIGIPKAETQKIELEMLTPSWVKRRLPSRSLGDHKGTYGHALIVGGSGKYPGAICLATQGALRSGVGLVTAAIPRTIQPSLVSRLIEAIQLALPDDEFGNLSPDSLNTIYMSLPNYNAIAVGCGIGQSANTDAFIKKLLLSNPNLKQPLVVDADGLNCLSNIRKWSSLLPTPTVLTPHPGEMSRLTGLSISEIQSRRIDIVKECAAKWGAIVVLKGAFTLIASPNGICRLSPFANPILATGGTGDILCGIIAGLAAQGMSLEDAASCGVYLHAAAAEQLKQSRGYRGATASDLLEILPGSTKAIMEI